MTEMEFHALDANPLAAAFGARHLEQAGARTLMLGRTSAQAVFHVYLDERHRIHRLVAQPLRHGFALLEYTVSLPGEACVASNQDYLPDDALQPECCDFAWCALFTQAGLVLPFDDFALDPAGAQAPRFAPYHGVTPAQCTLYCAVHALLESPPLAELGAEATRLVARAACEALALEPVRHADGYFAVPAADYGAFAARLGELAAVALAERGQLDARLQYGAARLNDVLRDVFGQPLSEDAQRTLEPGMALYEDIAGDRDGSLWHQLLAYLADRPAALLLSADEPTREDGCIAHRVFLREADPDVLVSVSRYSTPAQGGWHLDLRVTERLHGDRHDYTRRAWAELCPGQALPAALARRQPTGGPDAAPAPNPVALASH